MRHRKGYTLDQNMTLLIWTCRDYFGLTQYEARVLSQLVCAYPEPVTLPALAKCVNSSIGAVRVWIHSIRHAMECESIDSGPGAYTLTQGGADEIATAIQSTSKQFNEMSRNLCANMLHETYFRKEPA